MNQLRSTLRAHYDLLAALVLCAIWNARFAVRPGGGTADWVKELFYFTHIRLALVRGHLPGPFDAIPTFVAAINYPALQPTRSFWANPEVFTLSPFIPLLRWMAVPAFIKVLFVVHSAAACLGATMVGRRLGLRPAFRLMLVALTALNPWAMAHYAIGYTPHVNMLLCPWVAYLLLDPRRRVGSALAASAVTALMVYQGSLHVFVWTIFTAAGLAALATFAADRERLRVATFQGIYLTAASALAAPKLYASMLAYREFHREVRTGLLVINDLLGLLTDPSPIEPFVPKYNTSFWDGSIFMGWWFVAIMGLALLSALYRLYAGWTSPAQPVTRQLAVLGGGALAWLGCGWGTTWADFARVVRPLECEIYPYRFVFLSLMLVVTLVIVELNALFGEASGARRWVAAAVLLPSIYFGAVHYQMHTNTATGTDAAPRLREYEGEMTRATADRPR